MMQSVPEIAEDKGVLDALSNERLVSAVVASVLVEGKAPFEQTTELDHIYFIIIVEPSYEKNQVTSYN